MGHTFLGNISLISSVIDDRSPRPIGIIHPLLQPFLRHGSPGRIIRETKINNIRRFLWQFGNKIIFLQARHINHVAPRPFPRIIGSGPSRHYIRIHIYRIHRITDRNPVVHTENLLNIPGIAFCSVGNKNLVRFYIASTSLIIVLRNRVPQKFITKIGCISPKSFRFSHLVYRPVKGIYNRRRDRQGHVSDSKADHLLIGIRFGISVYLFSDCRK